MSNEDPKTPTPADLAGHLGSINEPPGSDVAAGSGGPLEFPPLVLSDTPQQVSP